MQNYQLKKYIKFVLLLMALAIAGLTLFFSNRLANEIAKEEKKKIEIWAMAEKNLNDMDADGDFTFHLQVIQSNTTIPALIVNEKGEIIAHRNLDSSKALNPLYLVSKLQEFKNLHQAIIVPVDENMNHKVYYGQSQMLSNIKYYPTVALALVSLFILVSYFAFNYSRRAEENRVWVGLAKETAHQLGTPISSLMGWIQYLELETQNLPEDCIAEMQKDLQRLTVITERFSKIGSEPELKLALVNAEITTVLDYLEARFKRHVTISRNLSKQEPKALLNVNLFHWVIENLVKNSIDAMHGKGTIWVSSWVKNGKIVIEIADHGHGIPQNKFKTIFKPGYTTKKRGWGLGLSLAYRIIKQYHKGLIYVNQSIPNKKTSIRISLRSEQ